MKLMKSENTKRAKLGKRQYTQEEAYKNSNLVGMELKAEEEDAGKNIKRRKEEDEK
jgi:hypothetical protein